VRPKIFSPTWASPEVVSTKNEGREEVARRLGRHRGRWRHQKCLREFGANRQKPPQMSTNQGPRDEGPKPEAPCAPPRRRCAAPGLGYAQPKAPKRFLVPSCHMEGGAIAIAADIRIPFKFFLRLGSLVLQVAALLARLDKISLCLQLPKANQLLAHLALLVGPEALSRPATAQKPLGRGGAPGAAARHLGWAVPSLKPPKKLRFRRKIEGSCSPRRTALRIPQKLSFPNFLPFAPPLFSRLLFAALDATTAHFNIRYACCCLQQLGAIGRD
jgi:hypothetical protein